MLTEVFRTDRLSDYDGHRDNNFTVVRFVLAFTVLFGHSFPISSFVAILQFSCWGFLGYSRRGKLRIYP